MATKASLKGSRKTSASGDAVSEGIRGERNSEENSSKKAAGSKPRKVTATKKTATKKTAKKKTAKKKTAKKKTTETKVTKKKTAKKKVTKKKATEKQAAKKAASKTPKRSGGKGAGAATKSPAKAPAAKSPAAGSGARDGQMAPQKARFELRDRERVLEPALGPPPPGYHLTIVRGWIRSPGHLVAAWDVNDEHALAQVERAGWERFCLRVLGSEDEVLAQQVLGRRGGTYHINVEPRAMTIRLVIGLAHEDGFFQTLARSGWIRMPPSQAQPGAGPEEFLAPSASLDRRVLLRADPPPRPGHQDPLRRQSPGLRLTERLRLAAASAEAGESRRQAAEALQRTAAVPADRAGSGGPEQSGREEAEPMLPGAGVPGAEVSGSSRHCVLEEGETRPTSPRRWGPTSPAGPFSAPAGDGAGG